MSWNRTCVKSGTLLESNSIQGEKVVVLILKGPNCWFRIPSVVEVSKIIVSAIAVTSKLKVKICAKYHVQTDCQFQKGVILTGTKLNLQMQLLKVKRQPQKLIYPLSFVYKRLIITTQLVVNKACA